MTNDTDLLGDTDDLRSLLRSRAALAPNPDDLLPATRPLARRRRLRRRGALFGGVVVLTTLALLGTTLLGSVDAPITPSGPPLIPPAFPFSVGQLPDGLVPTGWFSTGSDLTLQPFAMDYLDFTGPGVHVSVQWENFDPALTVIPTAPTPTPATVHGAPAVVVTDPTGEFASVSWPAAPERWFAVDMQAQTVIGESTLLAVADAVTATPGSPPTTLDIAHLPAGFEAFSWQQDRRGGVSDYVELCPTTMTKATGRKDCFTVVASNGSQTIQRAFFGNLVRIQHVRRIRGDVWAGVYPDQPVGISAAELDGLLREVSVG